MTYMDEWEYRIWLELHKEELLGTEDPKRSDEREEEGHRWPL